MLTVQFKAKPEAFGDRLYIKVPALKRAHADMPAFRNSRAFGGFANSDMFEAMLRAAVRRAVGERIWLDALPESVTVHTGSLLSTVTIALPDAR